MNKIKNYPTSIIRAQKQINLKKIKEILNSAIENKDNVQENLNEVEERAITIALHLNEYQIKERTEELNQIYSKCEDFYVAQDFDVAYVIVGFLTTQADKFGIELLKDLTSILEGKISLSLDIRRELEKMELFDLSIIPPLTIQTRFSKLETLLEESQSEKYPKDSIHPEIITEIKNLIIQMSKYMNEHGISRINPVEKKYQKIWASTKTNLDLKSKESKINRIIASAKKNISLISAKLELQKAYKMLQEHPSHFSLEKHNIVVKMISDIDNKISNVSENSGIFLDFTLEMLNDFRFIEVRKKLEEYKEKLDLEGFSHEVNEIKKQLELCNINEMTFKEVQKIERLLEENDRLGAKTAYLSLRDDIRAMDDAELLLFSLKERYFALEKQLKRNYSSINENYFKPFDPLEDINENLNNQGKLEKQLNKDEKIINISQENRNIHLKKEKDVLDALDEILNDNF